MANEVELKLLIAPSDIERVLRHSLVQTALRRESPPQQLLSIYYDTPTLALKKHRTALRLRRVGTQWIQTVKTEGMVAGGLHERPEWECETTEGTLALSSIPDPTVRAFFADEDIQHTLRPVFETDFTRTSCVLAFESEDVVELSIDQGEIRAGEQRTPICEVEFELKAGHPRRLFALARELYETIPFTLENVSKAERGYRLVSPITLAPVKATIPDFEENISASDGFVRILQGELTHLQANVEGALQSDDPEFIHQMRVALRRMRSTIGLFADLVEGEDRDPIRQELRWLTKELDAIRNWDVFVGQTLSTISHEFTAEQSLEQLKTESDQTRQRYRFRAREAVASARFQKLLLHIGAWCSARPWTARRPPQNDGPTDEPIAAFAARVLQQRHKQLKKRGKHLSTLSPHERHQVRIATKKLRYATEFFSSLYAQKRVRRYLTALTDVQEVLGILNDAATTEHLLQELAPVTAETRGHEATALIVGWVRGASRMQLTQLDRAWKDFLTQKAFW